MSLMHIHPRREFRLYLPCIQYYLMKNLIPQQISSAQEQIYVGGIQKDLSFTVPVQQRYIVNMKLFS